MQSIENILNSIHEIDIDNDSEIEGIIIDKMHLILEHYIQCNRGYHYNSIFEKIIKPYFDLVEVLESVLKSSVIKNKENVITGQTGAKIFPELLNKLLLVDSVDIKSYLKNEFKRESLFQL